MTQIQDNVERNARIVAQEIARTYDNGELYDATTVFVRLCEQIQESYPSLSNERLYVVVRQVLRGERRRRRASRD